MYTKEETCPGITCTARELYLQGLKKREPPGPDWKEHNIRPSEADEKGFYTCRFCGKPNRLQLVECPECHKFFKGPRPHFPIDYECRDC